MEARRLKIIIIHSQKHSAHTQMYSKRIRALKLQLHQQLLVFTEAETPAILLCEPNKSWRKLNLKVCTYVCVCLCNQCKNDGKHHLTGSNKAALKEKSSQSSQNRIYLSWNFPHMWLPHFIHHTNNCTFQSWISSLTTAEQYFNENLS